VGYGGLSVTFFRDRPCEALITQISRKISKLWRILQERNNYMVPFLLEGLDDQANGLILSGPNFLFLDRCQKNVGNHMAVIDMHTKKEIENTINELMKDIVTAAEARNWAKTFSRLTRKEGGLFFLNNRHYTLKSLLAFFGESYGIMKSLKMRVVKSEVVVFSPDAAAWIGYGDGQIQRVDTAPETTYSFTETWIWQKIDGEWVVTHYHESTG
jgi:hypothetical protein